MFETHGVHSTDCISKTVHANMISAPPLPSVELIPFLRSIFENHKAHGLIHLTGDSLKLFLWLIAYSSFDSKDRRIIRFKIHEAVLQTGISRASISRIIWMLRKKNLIILLERNYQSGNLWAVADAMATRDINVPFLSL